MKKKILLLLAVFTFAAMALFISSAQRAYADDVQQIGAKPDGLECHWNTSGQIICTWNGGTIKDIIFDRATQTNCGQWLTYTCRDFWFDAPASKEMGYPVFVNKSGESFLTFPDNDASQAFFIWWRPKSPPAYRESKGKSSNIKVALAKKGQAEAPNNDCSLLRTGNCPDKTVDGGTIPGLPGAGLDAGPFNKTLAEVAKQESIMDTCNNSVTLGFIFCPILEAINNGIASTIGGSEVVSGERKGIFISFLQLEPLLGKQAKNQAINQVVGNVVTVANVLYVFIFLVIIFSSSLPLGLNNYTIKKMLPKFIAAVILTQFSLLICGLVIDFFNILGQVVPNVIFFLGAGATTAIGSTSNLVVGGIGVTIIGGIAAAAASGLLAAAFILILIFAFIALISIFIAMIYMIIRYFILYALVIISPLAFVSWVLPGTEKFFYSWWKNFIRLNAMFVTIMGMLSLSLLMANVLKQVSDNPIQALIAALIPCVALLLVPKTLKWTTQGMSALAGGALTAVGAKGGAMTKSLASKGTQKSKAMANEKRQEQAALQFGKGRTKTASILSGRLPTKKGTLLTARESEAYTQERNKNNRASLKFAGSRLDYQSYGEELKKVASGQGSSVLKVGKNDRNMQLAAISEMAGRGDWSDLRDVQQTSGVDERTFSLGIESYGGDASTKAPDLLKPKAAAYSNISAEKITDLDKSSVQTMVDYVSEAIPAPAAGATADEIAAYNTAVSDQVATTNNLINAVQTIASDTKLSAKLSGEMRASLNSLGITDAGGNRITL